MRKIKIALTICLISSFILSGCSPEGVTDERSEKIKQSGNGVVEGTATHNTYSISNAGIFYIGRNWTCLMYYGYEADQNYVLCSASNCTHDSADCSAYVGDCYDIYGFSCYDGKLYYLRHQSYDSDKMEMISMDVDGTNKKVIAELDIGDYYAGSFGWKYTGGYGHFTI